MTILKTVEKHYSGDDLAGRVEKALNETFPGGGPLKWTDFAPLDQFHVGGLAATEQLAAALKLSPGATVLDVGCGLGGPARYLAATFGCRVTGIDLSPAFVEVANLLSKRAGLEDTARFQQADALALPFADGSFDDAWTQHVAMNTPDQKSFYENIHRVLKQGGRLALYDVAAGEGGPLHFPVPWAQTPDTSFLPGVGEKRALLRKAGFTEISWTDKTEEGLAWFAQQRSRPAPANRPLGLQVVMGPDFPGWAANLARNLKEDRARLVQAVMQKA